MFSKYRHIHMIGIGGTGMCGIADVLLTLGYNVSGSDVKSSIVTKRLKRRGAKIFKGHKSNNVKDADVVVVSSAINEKNSEVKTAIKKGIPIVPRAEMLAELMRLKYSVVVAGTHGKTTTTSLIGFVLDEAGLDPTLVIGGRLNRFKSNAKLGKGEYFVAEGDESDRSFLHFSPTIAVITNIEAEHMENYDSISHLRQYFTDFANKVPFYGSAVVCTDSPQVRKMLPSLNRRIITYGLKNAYYTLGKISPCEDKLKLSILRDNEDLGEVLLKLPGTHHATNALAAVAVALELGVSFKSIKKALGKFPGVARRFQILYKKGPIVVDDYGHHPTEISATIDAAKKGWPNKRVIAVCQPHRFSRLKYHFDGFVSALSNADAILITEVYSAGEKPLQRYTGEKLWKKMSAKYPRKQLAYVKSKEKLVPALLPWCRQEDIILFLGAGDITKMAHDLAARLKVS